MRKRGFTLVEIMIVVAIIALLAAIAIPNLLNARRTANDAAARSNIRTLCTMAETFAAGPGNGAYPTTLAELGGVAGGGSASTYCADLAGGTTALGGYTYACTSAAGAYSFTATRVSAQTGNIPVITGVTGGQITP